MTVIWGVFVIACVIVAPPAVIGCWVLHRENERVTEQRDRLRSRLSIAIWERDRARLGVDRQHASTPGEPMHLDVNAVIADMERREEWP